MLSNIQFRIYCTPVCYLLSHMLRYKKMTLSVVSYDYETGTLTLMEEHRLRVSEHRLLRTEETA
jgi:hypothetical protein